MAPHFVFITGETMSWQVLLQGREQMKIAGHQIHTVQCMVHFLTKLLQQVPSLLCPRQMRKVEEKNHTITKKPGCILLMASHKLCSVLQFLGINCVHVPGSPPATHPLSPRRPWPALCWQMWLLHNSLFMGKPGCLNSNVDHWLVGVKWWIHVSSPIMTQCRKLFHSCLTLQKSEKGHHSCHFDVAHYTNHPYGTDLTVL